AVAIEIRLAKNEIRLAAAIVTGSENEIRLAAAIVTGSKNEIRLAAVRRGGGEQ
ncbi:hypothetical protein U1Q18_025514, partial [Sarracenia purpurea var. burkii]